MSVLSSSVVTEDKLLYFKQKNDETYAKKSELNEAYTLPKASTTTLGGVKIGTNITVTDGVISVATPKTKLSELTNDSGFQTSTQVNSAISTAVSGLASTSYVDNKVSAVYKAAGSVSFSNLPALSADVVGNVYNVTNSFNTTADFVEGAGKTHSAGTNVVVVKVNNNYKFDVLAGFIDLSNYVLSSDISEIQNSDIDAMFQ